ncbi:alpha/beta-hydrolase [Mytilinidion resinicola]|uniref:Alpha/beta-hydrolase n=1 Tax=Mytilinidion resinicola TaxID=574789 RepID=A0A6A6Z416_9PEZI|nr:alpha/beta-hydrolase [Mytilinidion resinicola]KAF2815891.1 alpha/beta-hydrolase [Mytilinidion resinicola]
MSTQQTAPTLYLETNGHKYAYRYFGPASSPHPPLMFLQHFRGTMDHWDPELINPLAIHRPILLFDNAGVGKSSGIVADSFSGWAAHVVAFLDAFLPTINRTNVDLLGFSMGGMAAQMVALDTPRLVRKLVLAGTGVSWGPDVEGGDSSNVMLLASAVTDAEEKAAFLKTFYSPSAEKQARGAQWWERMNQRQLDGRSPYVDVEGSQRQLAAVGKWLNPETDPSEASYTRLGQLTIPVLVANGDNDVLIPSHNSWVLSQRIKTATLIIYPDVGHGFLNEQAEMFGKHVELFLDSKQV